MKIQTSIRELHKNQEKSGNNQLTPNFYDDIVVFAKFVINDN